MEANDPFGFGYHITENGEIFNTIRKTKKKLTKAMVGYLFTWLKHKGKKRQAYVHRLVASVYCPGFFVGAVVNHKDGNKTNNNKENLEWVTMSENIKHAAYVLNKATRGEKSASAKLKNNDIFEIRRLLLESNLSQKKIGNIFGVAQSTIHKIKIGIRWKHI